MRGTLPCLLLTLSAICGPGTPGVLAQEKYCLSKDREPYLYYSTKTAYYFVHARERPDPVRKCEPVHLWLLARHGTRYPGAKALQRYYDLEPIRDQVLSAHDDFKRGELCWEDRQALKNWKPRAVRPTDANMLTRQGREDMHLMAMRFKDYFGEILARPYTPDRYLIRYAESNRTRDSAQAFADGLFGADPGVDIPDEYQDDDLLMPNLNCSAMEMSKEDPKNSEEADLFKGGPLMTAMAERVSLRLGYTRTQKMDLLLQIYDACRFDKAWNISAVSPWCSAFHKEDLQLIEYYEDLKKYYQSGYGNSLTDKVGCPIVKDLITTFGKIANDTRDDEKSKARSVMYFVHSVMIRAVLTRLGIAEEEDEEVARPDHTNYERMADRKWRTSFISPFAANLAAVFYKCRGVGEVNKVMFFLNERRLDFDYCRVGLCDWSQIYYRFRTVVEDAKCSYDFCAQHSGSGGSKIGWRVTASAAVAAALLASVAAGKFPLLL